MKTCATCGTQFLGVRLPKGRPLDECAACILEGGAYSHEEADTLQRAAEFVYFRHSNSELRARILSNILEGEQFEGQNRFSKYHLLVLNTTLLGGQPPVLDSVSELRERLIVGLDLRGEGENTDSAISVGKEELVALAVISTTADPIENLVSWESGDVGHDLGLYGR